MLFYFGIAAAALLGLTAGSFLNVCISRLPNGRSVIFPPSGCPACGARIRAYDLIPVISYLLLRGKCRECGAKISIRYPLVELLSGAMYVLLLLKFGAGAQLVFAAIYTSALIVAFFTDLETGTVHDSTTITAGAAGLLSAVVSGSAVSSILGLLLGGASLWLIRAAGSYIYKREAMGEGDVWLAAAAGAVLGWKGVILCIPFSFIITAAVSVALLILKIKKREEEVPLGPGIVASALAILFFGDAVWRFYFGG